MDHFKGSVKKENGRYQVAWPWRDENCRLPDNYDLCIGRLKSLQKRLREDPELFRSYEEGIKNQLEKGMIEIVSEQTEKGDKLHYIPHRAVIKPENNTTKLRVMYDASAKTKKSNLSLNECLHRGPVILEDICGLLMKFRIKKIGIVADIEKAFLQIGLQPKQRDVTRFLWLKDINLPATQNNIITYSFTRVPFGIVTSSFLLGATIKHHLENNDGDEINSINRDIYVDNLITGADNNGEANKLYWTCKSKFKEISMSLREWKSSSSEVNELFQCDEMKESNVKVLGLHWNTTEDKMAISTGKFDNSLIAISKRQVLASIASLFDPLGYLSPTTMKMRLFLQKLWTKEKKSDDTMEDDEIEKWKQIVEETKELSTIEIPRYIGSKNNQLICFCDASKNAYATAIYLKSQDEEGNCRVNLIFSKSRIAPKKAMSRPRLELMALLIGVRCLKFVSQELRLENTPRIIWTDSQCVLN